MEQVKMGEDNTPQAPSYWHLLKAHWKLHVFVFLAISVFSGFVLECAFWFRFIAVAIPLAVLWGIIELSYLLVKQKSCFGEGVRHGEERLAQLTDFWFIGPFGLSAVGFWLRVIFKTALLVVVGVAMQLNYLRLAHPALLHSAVSTWLATGHFPKGSGVFPSPLVLLVAAGYYMYQFFLGGGCPDLDERLSQAVTKEIARSHRQHVRNMACREKEIIRVTFYPEGLKEYEFPWLSDEAKDLLREKHPEVFSRLEKEQSERSPGIS
ncbi:hypothetical protein JKG47_00995 [Acidithiobacillus sp. MC6.1]|nr:hypothetical protein [Acidithiobacillus sp. MC6.1]